MSDPTDPRIPSAFRTATPAEPHLIDSTATPGDSDRGADPLRLCVATTVALIAWLVSPPVAVIGFGAMALVGYTRSYRAGLLRSRCALGDTRLVLAYLTAAVIAGAVGLIMGLT